METEHSLHAASQPTTVPTMPAAIRTPDQRVRVFISSTLDELAPERTAAREAITQLRLTPVLFESGARPYPPGARAAIVASHEAGPSMVRGCWRVSKETSQSLPRMKRNPCQLRTRWETSVGRPTLKQYWERFA